MYPLSMDLFPEPFWSHREDIRSEMTLVNKHKFSNEGCNFHHCCKICVCWGTPEPHCQNCWSEVWVCLDCFHRVKWGEGGVFIVH